MTRSSLNRLLAAMLPLLVALSGLALVPAPASAEAAPATTPATVTADALPTWQVNGVVWNQLLVGNTVYVTGNFTKARPPGVAEGGAGEVNAGSLFAYDIRTGNRVSTFNHTLNGPGRFVAASPDGSRIYVGGEFSTVDGQVRSRIAAFNTSDGSLVANFAPVLSARVNAIAVSATTVYIGGQFTKVGTASRSRLAAVQASNGALLPWAPAADKTVTSMVLAPGGASVVVGGSFLTLAGTDADGMGSLNASSGEVLPWEANQQIRNGGTTNSAILSLRTDGTNIFGTGFSFGVGNFEGTFSANPTTGKLNWVNDCHGDTYDVAPVGDVVYNVSHVHDCSAIRDFPESIPRWVNTQHGTALTNYAATTNIGPDAYGWNYSGLPAAKVLPWYPDLTPGTITGQDQAGWTVSANSQYVAIGGEFPRVNGVAQQSLTRFAIRSLATNKRGPVTAPDAPAPSALATTPGTLRVAWPAAYDQDDSVLTYQVFRSGKTEPVYTTTLASSFWNHPLMGFKDTGLAPGSYRYTVKASDPSGNVRTLAQTPATTTTSRNPSAYVSDVLADQPTAFWRLGESSGSAVPDYANFNDAAAAAGVARGAVGAIAGDADTASTFDGTEAGAVGSVATIPSTPSLAVEAWFKTTTTSGGKIVGYSGSPTGTSGSYDRHIYMTNDGRLVFGAYPGTVRTVTSTKTYNDGQYHQVVGVLDADEGMSLWVDGTRVATNPGGRGFQEFLGYWRIGGDGLSGWPDRPASNYFAGTIDDVSVYPAALSKAQIQKHYTDSGRTVVAIPAPTDAYGSAVVADEPSLYWRLGDARGAGSAADGSGNNITGVISNGGIEFGGDSGVSGTADGSAAFDGSSGTLGSSAGFVNPSVYSEELWFKTTTTQGGKLIGFGDAQTGTSNSYDRHVYMEDSGQLTFGTYSGQVNAATSSASYNDGAWHHMVATQGPAGMTLYVDAVAVASNQQTGAQRYDGYWRVGGDTPWNGRTYFSGSLDEVAVYDHALGAADVLRHYVAGGGRPNELPVASFTSSPVGSDVSFDGSGSSDPDGTVTSYSWNWGDQTPDGSGVSPSHSYAASGTYQVTLTVTDNRSGTARVTHGVVVVEPNRVPTASFSSRSYHLATKLDGSGSSDPDGTVTSYSWSWGDQTPDGSGVRPSHTFAAAGTYPVTLTVTDDQGGTATVTHEVVVSESQSPAPTDAYGSAVVADEPSLYWRLGDARGAGSAADGSGNNITGVISNGGIEFGGDSGVSGTADGSAAFDGSSGTLGSSVRFDNPSVYSEELWFKTTTTQGGKLIGFGDAQTGTSNSYDRHVYMEDSGQLTFGTYTGQINLATSSASYNDGAWHHMVATQGPAGMTLYVDAVAVASNQQTAAQSYDGYWRVGGDTPWNGRTYFSGSLDEVAVYDHALSAADVSRHFASASASASANQAPVAKFSSTTSDLVASFDASASSDPDGTVASYAWSWGDGTAAGSGVSPSHTYTAAGTYTVSLTVTDDRGETSTVRHDVVVAAANVAPVAKFSSETSDLVASFDASASSDPDGTVASYAWSWGDGTAAGSGVSPSHTYTAAGTYTVSLTVTDDRGATDQVRRDVVVAAANVAPVAKFSSTTSDLVASFDASASSDPDGTVASYAWSWGDGTAAGSGVSPSHTYTAAGTYTVALTVTDDRGATDQVRRDVVVAAANVAPVASFTSTATNLVASFDASASSDPDGTVASYAWSWGDGTAAGSGVSPSHTYTAAGTYTVSLTVTDDRGATDQVRRDVVVAAANVAPVAKFSSTTSDLVASFDASASSDPDGTVASYAWSWGDGTAAGSGVSPSHTYTAAGTYTVSLTVTDNRGATATTTTPVRVAAPVSYLARDGFSRTVAGGWGSTDSGAAWIRAGAASAFGVGSGLGTISAATAGSGPSMSIDRLSAAATDTTVSVGVNKLPVGGTMFVQTRPRQVGSDYYHADVRVAPSGSLSLALLRKVGTSDTTLTSVALAGTYTPNTRLNIRVQAVGTGTATLRAKVWVAGTAEPLNWQLSATDSAASLQVAGTVGLGVYLGAAATNAPIVAAFDDLTVVPAG